MACEIKITEVIVTGSPGQPVSSVTVEGTAEECNQNNVVVIINCGGPEKTMVVMADPLTTPPKWKALFSASHLAGSGCICGSGYMRVTAKCKADETCLASLNVPPSECKPEQYCCPVVNAKYTVGDCDAQGHRLVTFEINVTPVVDPSCPPKVFAELHFGDGTTGQGFTVPPDYMWTETHPYAPGTSYTAWLEVIDPSGCKYPEIIVGPLEECPCPTVTLDNPSVEGCVGPHDKATVTAKAKVEQAVAGAQYEVTWTFEDGPVMGPETVTAPAPSFEITKSCEYNTHGTYAVSVTIKIGLCSVTDNTTFPVKKCHDGDDHGDGRPCKWWEYFYNPNCWKLCQILPWLALSMIIAASIAFMTGMCTENWLLAGIAAAVMVAGFGSLLLWYEVCSKSKVDFCDTLKKLIQLITWIMYTQGLIALVGTVWSLIEGGKAWCILGFVLGFAYYAYLLNVLKDIREWADCPH